MSVSVDFDEPPARLRVKRRRWSVETKRRLVALTQEPGASMAAVAREHGLNANLLFNWRRQLGRGALVAAMSSGPATSFAPIDVVAHEHGSEGAPGAGRMEIELKGGTRVRVDGAVSQSALVRVLMALKVVA